MSSTCLTDTQITEFIEEIEGIMKNPDENNEERKKAGTRKQDKRPGETVPRRRIIHSHPDPATLSNRGKRRFIYVILIT